MTQENLVLKTKIELFLALLAEDHQAPVLDELVAALMEDDRADQAVDVLYWALDHGRDNLDNRLRLTETLLTLGRSEEAGPVLARAKGMVDDAVSKMDWIARLEQGLDFRPDRAPAPDDSVALADDGEPTAGPADDLIEEIDLDQDLISLARSGQEIDLQGPEESGPVEEPDLAALLLAADEQPDDLRLADIDSDDQPVEPEAQPVSEPMAPIKESAALDDADELLLSETDFADFDESCPDEADLAGPAGETAGDDHGAAALDALLIDEDEPAEEDESTDFQPGSITDDFGATEGEADSDESLTSPTIANLYLNQGHQEAAIEVYRKLLKKDPRNRAIRAKLKNLGGMPDNWALPRMLDILTKWRSLITGRTETA